MLRHVADGRRLRSRAYRHTSLAAKKYAGRRSRDGDVQNGARTVVRANGSGRTGTVRRMRYNHRQATSSKVE